MNPTTRAPHGRIRPWLGLTAVLLGMSSAALDFSFIYAALDQGRRLDWLAPSFIVALLPGPASPRFPFRRLPWRIS